MERSDEIFYVCCRRYHCYSSGCCGCEAGQGGTFAGSPKARMVNETDTGEAADQDASGESESVDSENAEPTMSPEELAQAETDAQKKSVVESYNNLGLVQVSGYLNMRESARQDAR